MEWITPSLIGTGIVALGRLIQLYSTISTKLKELELRVNMVERQDDRILNKLDDIAEDLQQIKLDLKDKQDRE